MHIDGDKAGVTVQCFPLGDEGLPAGGPGGVQRVDQAWVVFQAWAWQYLVGGSCCAGIGRAQAQNFWVEEIRCADVATWLAAVGVVDWIDVGEGVGDRWLDSVDGADESGEGEVGRDNFDAVCQYMFASKCLKAPGGLRGEEHTGIIGRTVVVLDFLNQDERWAPERVGNVGGDLIQVGRRRREVLDVIGAYGQTRAITRRDKFCRGWQSRLGRRGDLQACQG